jgi:hypothetical protein
MYRSAILCIYSFMLFSNFSVLPCCLAVMGKLHGRIWKCERGGGGGPLYVSGAEILLKSLTGKVPTDPE